jgi:hypothetical protein
MGRSLEYCKFGRFTNNGITAFTTDNVRINLTKIKAIEEKTGSKLVGQLAHMPDIPVFTFCEEERFKVSPWLTGSHDLFKKLITFISNRGGVIVETQFYVPFSNHYESGKRGQEQQKAEMHFVTSQAQFYNAFGVTLEWLSTHKFHRIT